MKKIEHCDAIIFVSEFSSCRTFSPKEDFFKLSKEEQEEKLQEMAKEVMPMLLCKELTIFKAQHISECPPQREVFEKMFKERKIKRIRQEAEEKIAKLV